jgi:hypothetical protein
MLKRALNSLSKSSTNRRFLSSANVSDDSVLYGSVCVERLPIITCEMNDIEIRYSNYINQLNIKNSALSNHELRHLKDL